ncbi:MAG: SpoIIE family protein phosphatase [Pseudomonadota bacterium]
MIICTTVNIFFTNRDVGKAMLTAQEKSAKNILHSLDLIIKDDYLNLVSDRREMVLLKRDRLKNIAVMIESVFNGYGRLTSDDLQRSEAINSALEWLNSAPFEGIDYYITDKESKLLACSNKLISNENYRKLQDTKHRNLSEIMRFNNLNPQGDFATFVINPDGAQDKSVLAYFHPLKGWEFTIATSIDISNIEAESQIKKNKIIGSLTEFSKHLDITQNGFVYMFDSNNNILIPPPHHIKTVAYSSTNILTKNTVIDDIRASSTSGVTELRFVSSDDETKQYMIAYCHYFKSLQWYTSVIVPVVEIKQPAFRLVVRQSIVICIVFMIGLLAVFILVTRIATPLKSLASYARELPELDFTKPLTLETSIDDLPGRYRDEVGALASSFILMRQKLNKNIQDLVVITASRQRIDSELSIAREIQLGMVPRTFPPFPRHIEFDLFATLIPAKEIGGDLYDFFFIDSEHLCFALGDVSDKGIPAALLMVVTRTLIRTLYETIQSPCEVMRNLNNILSADNPRTMFVTLIIGVLNIKTGVIEYANGGHNPPIVIPQNDDVFFIRKGNDPLVGAMAGMSYTNHTLTLSPGESFFLYTDGVNEAMNPNGEQYSNNRLLSDVAKNKTKSSSEIIETVLESIKEHSQTAPQSDDIAMLIIRYNGKELSLKPS